MPERIFVSKREAVRRFAAASSSEKKAKDSLLERNSTAAKAFSLMEFLNGFERKYNLSSEELFEDSHRARVEPNLTRIDEGDLVLWSGSIDVAARRGVMRENPPSLYKQAS